MQNIWNDDGSAFANPAHFVTEINGVPGTYGTLDDMCNLGRALSYGDDAFTKAICDDSVSSITLVAANDATPYSVTLSAFVGSRPTVPPKS